MISSEPGTQGNSEYFIYQGEELNGNYHPNMALCGHYNCGFGYSVKRQYYDYLFIGYILEGSFHLKYKGRKYRAVPGQVVIIDCRSPHHFWAGRSLEFLWIHFSGGNTPAMADELNNYYGPIIDHKNNAHIRDRLTSLVSLYRNRQELCAPELAELILDLLYKIYPAGEGKDRREGILSPPVKAATEYMKYHLGDPLSIDGLAEVANLSRFHFSRIFKGETGFSPYEYLIKLRINTARHLLETTDDSVKEIAFSLGYESSTGFSMAFSRREGCSPGEYRKGRR